jgi:glycosyltransferase involved in cell wall biosynthesis
MPEAVLQLLGPSTGGIRRHVGALADALEAGGWAVVVAGPADVLEGIRATDVLVPVPAELRPLQLGRAVRALRRRLRDVAIVHAHGLKAGWVAILAVKTRRPRAAVAVTVHNLVLDETDGRSVRFLRVLERQVFRRADALIAVSPEVGGYVHEYTARPVRVIRPLGPVPVPRRPLDTVRLALGARDRQPLVVCVARLHPQKGLPTLIQATRLLRDRGVDVRVAIVGEGPSASELQRMIARLGLDGAIVLAGPSDNAPDELAAADLVVIPSVWESGPLVLAEALLLVRPVVATPVGLVPEVIRDGESGRIVPIGDPRALADAMAEVLADPNAAAGLARAGCAAVRQVLGPHALVQATEALYREILRQP